MNSSRIFGGLLSIASALVAILHIGIGYWKLETVLFGVEESTRIPLAFALPVTVFLLVATGLGFWLGWIMATTKEPEPAPAPETGNEIDEEAEEETKEE